MKTRRRIDLAELKDRARNHWPRIVPDVFGIPREFLSGQHGPCPQSGCGGHNRWRTFDDFAETGGAICNQCGRNLGDGLALGMWFTGKPLHEVASLVDAYLGGSPRESTNGHYGKNGTSNQNGKPKRGKKTIDPAEHLEFEPWNESLAALWCGLHKPGITPEAMLAAGGRVATYRQRYTVFAFPVWGQKLTEAEPVGWVLYHAGGSKLPKFTKGAQKIELVKVKLTAGSQPGWVGPVDRLKSDNISTVWKTEGTTDLLALLSQPIPVGTTAITNANGAGERPQPWMLDLLAGKSVRIVHDADQPGERGAAGHTDPGGRHRPGWVEQVAAAAAEARHVRLPYPVEPDHGRDLRDFFNDGHTLAELEDLATQATPATAPTSAAAGGTPEPSGTPIEADDDPHRLARVNLERYASHTAGATLRYWRSEFWTWKPDRGCYRAIEEKELRAKLTVSIKAEFDRINLEQQAEAWRDEPPKVKQVSTRLIGDVLNATKSLTLISGSIEQGTWLEGHLREQRNYVAMKNGIIDINRLLENRPADSLADVLLPHSPNWFSGICLPYDFDPAARCPRWEKFLKEELWAGDPESTRALQQWAGYLLSGQTNLQKILMIIGPKRSGKGTVARIFAALLGKENVAGPTLAGLGTNFGLQSLLGKPLAIISDARLSGRVDQATIVERLLSISGEDMQTVDRKFLGPVTLKLPTRFIILSNELPRLGDNSGAMASRIILLQLTKSFFGRENVRLTEELLAELPGIFCWALAGWHDLLGAMRISQPQSALDLTEDLENLGSPIGAFVRERCCLKPGWSATVADLYTEWKIWCEANGRREPGTVATFGRDLLAAVPQLKRIQPRNDAGGRYRAYEGIGILGQQANVY